MTGSFSVLKQIAQTFDCFSIIIMIFVRKITASHDGQVDLAISMQIVDGFFAEKLL